MKSKDVNKGMRMGLLIAALLVVALVVPSGPAYAGSCTGGSTCEFDLMNSNVAELNGFIDIRVTWNNTGATTVLSVEWISGGPGTPKFINEFGYNTPTDITSIGGNIGDSTWSQVCPDGGGCPANESLFGTFEGVVKGTKIGTNTPGVGGAIEVTLESLITSIPDNARGAQFVAHVGGYPSGCSGWASDGTASSTESNTSCAPIPEPTSLLLVGSGLAGLGLWRRARRKGAQA